MGFVLHNVQFEQVPNLNDLSVQMLKLTGLPLLFTEYSDVALNITHPTRPKSTAIVYFKKHSIVVESNSPRWNYIEGSVMYLLEQLGGHSEKDATFPNWAGKKWIDAYPRSPFKQFKDWWNGVLPF
jgi:hypothetical protein